MRLFQICKEYVVILLGIILLSACGGDSSPTYEINTDISNIDFVLYTNTSSEASENVNVTFQGDGVIVGYPPGQSEPHWLIVDTLASNNNSATFRISAAGYFSETGTLSSTLRFVTGKVDGSAIKYKEVNVTLTVEEGFAIENESLTNTAESIGKNIEDIALDFNTFTILGGNTDWTIERPEWVILSKTDGQGPSSINISIDPQYADYGINNGSIIVYDSVSRENFGFEINYELKHADVTIDTEPHTFSVNNNTPEHELTSTINIQDSLNGLSAENTFLWSVASSQPDWLSFAQTDGSSAYNSHSPQIIIDKEKLLTLTAGENHKVTITIAVESDFSSVEFFDIDVISFVQSSPVTVTDSLANNFDFNINDASYSDSQGIFAFSDTDAKKIYIVNAKSGKTESYYSFNEMPDTLSISPNGKYLYASMLTQAPNYFQESPGGKVAVIDLEEEKLINLFSIDIDPWDIEGTDDGLAYVSAGSGQWTQMKRYNALTGYFDIEGQTRHRITLQLSADQQSVYSVTTDSYPRNIYNYVPFIYEDNETFLSENRSPYHGTYDIGDKLWLDSQNNRLITEFRNVFNGDDLTHYTELNSFDGVIENLTFDYANDKVIIIKSNRYSNDGISTLLSLDLPNYDNYQVITTSTDTAKFVFNDNGEYIIVIESDTGWYLSRH